MKTAFVDTLIELAKKDKRIWLLTGDLGFGVFEPFIKKFPERFINCGIIEQSMMGIAAGLAMEGKKPYVYSIIPFITFRCMEQIRNDICYQDLDVKIIGAGGHQHYKGLGFTHNIKEDEDIKLLSDLPNIRLFTPDTPEEVRETILRSHSENKPSYIRL